MPMKFNKIRPTQNNSKVSSKVCLGKANKVLCKDVFNPRSISTCNLSHKVAKIPHVKPDIRKPSNNQWPTVSPNIIGYLRLKTHKPSPPNILKPPRSVTNSSHLMARNSAHQKLHHDCGADTENVSANHFCYKSNHLWGKYHVKKS